MNLQCNACGTRFRTAIAEARHRHNFPSLCKRNAAFSLFVAQNEADAAKERVRALEYQLGEVLGCLDEYAAMPCASLRQRAVQAGARAKRVLKPLPPGTYTAKIKGIVFTATGEPIVEIDYDNVTPVTIERKA